MLSAGKLNENIEDMNVNAVETFFMAPKLHNFDTSIIISNV